MGAFNVVAKGIEGQPAPELVVDEWVHLPEETKAPTLESFSGKVVYLYFFQSWCPGCHSSGFPTLKKIIEAYGNNEEVAIATVQTTFEGFSTNDAGAALNTAKRYDLDIPVGHSGVNNRASELMRAYQTRGTPWTVIIDRDGVVRFNDFHIAPEQATQLIKELSSPTS
jgi:thiol-disulfide isomerase/thioredoxin